MPRRVRTCVLALKNGTAHATPSTPLTRCSTVSRRGYGTSIVFTAGSITQMSASGASSITLAARESSPKRIETCWQSRSVLKATPNTRPTYLVASPNSIRNATTNMPISWMVDSRSYSQRSPPGGTSILVTGTGGLTVQEGVGCGIVSNDSHSRNERPRAMAQSLVLRPRIRRRDV